MMRREAFCAGAILVLPLEPALAQNAPGQTSRIVGIVVDSTHGSGLEGAEVLVSGVSSPVRTDSQGRFAIEGLSAGTYKIGVFHPLLESLGLTLSTKPFFVGRDSTGIANLAIPSVKTLASRYCRGELTSSRPAAIAGRVRDPDTDEPISAATVSLAWVDISVRNRREILTTPHELRVDTDASGFFKFCGLPDDIDGTVQAIRGGLPTAEVPVTTRASPLVFESLALSASQATLGRGIVRGTVRSLDDEALGGARIEVPVTGAFSVTKPDGLFSIDVPSGTQVIVIRRLGFEPVSVQVNVTSHLPVELNVTLGITPNILDPVLVTARRNYVLEKQGFLKRMGSARGTYITHEDVEKRKPFVLTDLLRDVPGIRVTHTLRGSIVGSDRTRSTMMGTDDGCTRLWVDGSEWSRVMPGDLDAYISTRDLAGLEVYRPGTAPAEFNSSDGCVTLVAWTQVQPRINHN
jgi:hypothetical protein